MPSASTLNQLLSANSAADPADVLRVKTLLKDLGLYQTPDWGMTEYPDPALFDAIETFQKGTKLRVDGVMNPGGETESALKTAAELVRRHGRNGDTILAHITPAEAQLLDRITDGATINPDTGLPEFFIGDMLGSIAGNFMGSSLGSAVGDIAGKAIGGYAAKKISQKVGGPVGEILGDTVGGYLGGGSASDIAGGMTRSFGDAVGGYASRKVNENVGGGFGTVLGDALGQTVSQTVGNSVGQTLSGGFGPKDTTPEPARGAMPDPFKPGGDIYRTPGINPDANRQAKSRQPAAPVDASPSVQPQPSWPSPDQSGPRASKSNPIVQGPLGPVWNPVTGKYVRAKDLRPPQARAQSAQAQPVQAPQPARAQPARATYGPKLPAETVSSNARLADALTKTSDYSAIKPHVQNAWNSGAQGQAEVLNLAGQLGERNPELGKKFSEEMGLNMQADPTDARHKLQAVADTPEDKGGASRPVSPPPLPSNKHSWFRTKGQEENWKTFHDNLQTRGELGSQAQHTFQEIFGQEGGMTSRDNGTTAGMQPGRLKSLIDQGYVQDIEPGTSPKDLSLEQMQDAYKGYFDETFKAVGGAKALESIRDKGAAAVLGDSLFSHGTGEGAEAIQRGINKVRPGMLYPDRAPGSKTLDALDTLTSDPKTRDATLNAIADARWAYIESTDFPEAEKKVWKDRIDYYRPTSH